MRNNFLTLKGNAKHPLLEESLGKQIYVLRSYTFRKVVESLLHKYSHVFLSSKNGNQLKFGFVPSCLPRIQQNLKHSQGDLPYLILQFDHPHVAQDRNRFH